MTLPGIILVVLGCVWAAAVLVARDKVIALALTGFFGVLGLVAGTALVHLHPVVRVERVNAVVVPSPSVDLAPAGFQHETEMPRLTGLEPPANTGVTLQVNVMRSSTALI